VTEGQTLMSFRTNENMTMTVDSRIMELEKMWEVQDRWLLIAWGLRQKQALKFRKHFLTCTEHLKDRFRILLGKFL